jgi:hypothetical protein
MTVSAVVIACVIFAAVSICEIYENIRYIGYGEYTDAIEITEEKIRILDFTVG